MTTSTVSYQYVFKSSKFKERTRTADDKKHPLSLKKKNFELDNKKKVMIETF